MSDDRFDEWVQRAAADYNRPVSDVPRDEIWARIQAGRVTGASADSNHVVRVLPMRSSTPRWLPAALAAASVLIIGVAIGRFTTPDRRPAASSAVATTPPTPTAPDEEGLQLPAVAAGNDNDTSVIGAATPAPSARRPVRGGDDDTPRLAASGPDATPGSAGNGANDANGAYASVTEQHLARAEALLTSYHTDAVDGRVDAQMSAWARDLLTMTRLLLDSPAARGVQRRRLLQDLELVLVQIVQLSPDAAEDERALVERSIDREHMIMRLRATPPAGAASGT